MIDELVAPSLDKVAKILSFYNYHTRCITDDLYWKKKNQHTFTYLNSIFTSPFPAHVGTADGLFAGRLFVLWLHFLQEWRRVLLVWTPVGFIQCHGGGSPNDACPPCVI